MDAPMPELQSGQQEQELRQILNKDKSKRSKSRAWLPCALPGVRGPPRGWEGCVGGSPFAGDALCPAACEQESGWECPEAGQEGPGLSCVALWGPGFTAY